MTADVRPKCVDRDGYCRIAGVAALGPCDGPSEWSHFGESKRFKTRGMEPEERHTTEGSLMFCKKHHDEYDGRRRPRLKVEATTDRRCDGPLRYEREGVVYVEEETDAAA